MRGYAPPAAQASARAGSATATSTQRSAHELPPLLGLPLALALVWVLSVTLLCLTAREFGRALVPCARARGLRSLVLGAAPSWRTDGTIANPAVDAWLRTGRAAVPDPRPLRARGGRIWVLIDLRAPAAEVPP